MYETLYIEQKVEFLFKKIQKVVLNLNLLSSIFYSKRVKHCFQDRIKEEPN